MTAVLDASTDLQERARQAYRQSVAAGAPLSREALGARFERSPSWARDRIAEARDTTATLTVTAPVTPVSGPPPAATDTPADTSPADEVTPAPAVEVAPAKPARPGTGVTKRPKPVTPSKSTGDTPSAVIATPTVTAAVTATATPAPAPTDTPAVSHRGARLMAWSGFAIGSLVSVAGNWLAAWLPAGVMPPGWAPSLPSQVGAAVWPVALLVSIEVLSRTAWRPGKAWLLVRLGGMGVVALGSGVISYGHIHAVLLSWGYDWLGAGVGPLVIDGLMVVSGFALLSMSTANTRKA